MKSFKGINFSLFGLLITVVLIANGCAYMQNRGRDAMDILDVGITVSEKPKFGFYFDFFNITPLGYANVEGQVLGMANRQAGLLDYENRSWGALLWGKEKHGSGVFNPDDPHQARPDQRDLKERPEFNAGIPRMIAQDDSPPTLTFFQCNRGIHLAWIGFVMNVRPLEIIDFLLGWTTLDMSGDDHVKPQVSTTGNRAETLENITLQGKDVKPDVN